MREVHRRSLGPQNAVLTKLEPLLGPNATVARHPTRRLLAVSAQKTKNTPKSFFWKTNLTVVFP